LSESLDAITRQEACKLTQACQVLLEGKTSPTSINIVVTGTPLVVIDAYHW
jgi:hypothetical protein